MYNTKRSLVHSGSPFSLDHACIYNFTWNQKNIIFLYIWSSLPQCSNICILASLLSQSLVWVCQPSQFFLVYLSVYKHTQWQSPSSLIFIKDLAATIQSVLLCELYSLLSTSFSTICNNKRLTFSFLFTLLSLRPYSFVPPPPLCTNVYIHAECLQLQYCITLVHK